MLSQRTAFSMLQQPKETVSKDSTKSVISKNSFQWCNKQRNSPQHHKTCLFQIAFIVGVITLQTDKNNMTTKTNELKNQWKAEAKSLHRLKTWCLSHGSTPLLKW